MRAEPVRSWAMNGPTNETPHRESPQARPVAHKRGNSRMLSASKVPPLFLVVRVFRAAALGAEGGNGAHPTGLKIFNGFDEFLSRVHDERAVACDRLADRYSSQQ